MTSSLSSRSAGFQPARVPGRARRPLHAQLGRVPYFVSTRVQKSKRVFGGQFAQEATRELVALREQYGFLLLAYVFMPDHAHFVIVPTGDFSVSQTMRLIKGRIARRTNGLLNQEGRLWQEGFFEYAPRTIEQLNAYIEYVHANPVKAGLAGRPEDYDHSSASGDCMAHYESFFEAERES
ncbi:MAG: transposase [Chloroflexi bacterium]|nr:transposase [Chloroflexota bacterium]